MSDKKIAAAMVGEKHAPGLFGLVSDARQMELREKMRREDPKRFASLQQRGLDYVPEMKPQTQPGPDVATDSTRYLPQGMAWATPDAGIMPNTAPVMTRAPSPETIPQPVPRALFPNDNPGDLLTSRDNAMRDQVGRMLMNNRRLAETEDQRRRDGRAAWFVPPGMGQDATDMMQRLLSEPDPMKRRQMARDMEMAGITSGRNGVMY